MMVFMFISFTCSEVFKIIIYINVIYIVCTKPNQNLLYILTMFKTSLFTVLRGVFTWDSVEFQNKVFKWCKLVQNDGFKGVWLCTNLGPSLASRLVTCGTWMAPRIRDFAVGCYFKLWERLEHFNSSRNRLLGRVCWWK